MKKGYIAFVLTDQSRNELAKIFQPLYDKWIGHHITYEFGVNDSSPLPKVSNVQVVGYCSDYLGLECLVVAVDGDIRRNDGKIYHITWSLNKNRKPVESNNLLANQGFTKLDMPIGVDVDAEFIAF